MRHCAASVLLVTATVAVLPRVGLAQNDPVAIFRQAIDTRNTGDIVAMMALFTDDAVREDGSSQPPCVGFAAVRASFQKDPAFGRFAGCPAPSQVAPGRSDHARS
jgi:hypothetical protein